MISGLFHCKSDNLQDFLHQQISVQYPCYPIIGRYFLNKTQIVKRLYCHLTDVSNEKAHYGATETSLGMGVSNIPLQLFSQKKHIPISIFLITKLGIQGNIYLQKQGNFYIIKRFIAVIFGTCNRISNLYLSH